MEMSPEQIADNWSAAAAGYDELVSLFLHRYAIDALRLVPPRPGQRVLEVAAGTGALSLRAAGMGADVLATDFAPGMVEYLARRARTHSQSNLRVELMDGQALPLEDACFEAAYSVFGIMFFPDRAAGFREMLRVLVPGGRAAVVTWSAIERSPFFQAVARALRQAVPDLPAPRKPPLWMSLSERDTLRAEMQGAGFRNVNIYSVTHVCVFPSIEWMSERIHEVSPVTRSLLDGLSAAQRKATSEAFIDILRSAQGEGPYGLEAEAHIAVGAR